MKKRVLGLVQLMVACSVLLFGMAQPVQAVAPTQSVGFPMYEFPGIGTLWPDVYAASSQVPWIIINPASGPGTSVSPYYTTALAGKPSNQRAIGYVHSNYNTRDITEVLSDIDDWYVMYPEISGIFMDLLQNGGAPANVCYGATVHNYVKSKRPNDLVVMNPGSNVEAVYEPYSDIFGNAEGTIATYGSWAPYTDGFENDPAYADRFWHIIHTSDAADLSTAMTMTRNNNAGWVLVTDLLMPNPYTAVPTYWTDFLDEVNTLPQTAIPNRGLTALPAGCLDLSLQTTKTSTVGTANVTSMISNTVTNLDTTRSSPGSTTLSYDIPDGATLTGLSGTGWNCSVATKQCTNDSDIAATTALPTVTVTVAVGCDFSSGSIDMTLKNFANNTATATSALSRPADCVVPSPEPTTGNSPKPAPTTAPTTTPTPITASQGDPIVVEEETVTTTTPPEPLPAQEDSLPSENGASRNDENTDIKPQPESSPLPVVLGVAGVLLAGGLGAWLLIRRRG